MGIRRQKTTTSNDNVAESTTIESVTVDRKALMAEMDDLLDEIDEALETNAEEFVRNYVQKGGQ